MINFYTNPNSLIRARFIIHQMVGLADFLSSLSFQYSMKEQRIFIFLSDDSIGLSVC
jgi:hypothetical protein